MRKLIVLGIGGALAGAALLQLTRKKPGVTPGAVDYNLPDGIGVGGAEGENNRMSFTVGSWPNDRSSHAKEVRVEMRVSAFPRTIRLRAKKGPPEKIAKYLADFITKTAADVPPKFTHSTNVPSGLKGRLRSRID